MILQDKMLNKVIDLAMEYWPKLLAVIVLVVVGYWLIGMILNFLDKVMRRSRLDVSLQPFIKSVINVALKVLLVITAASTLGIPMTTFIAVLSAAGLAIGLALKDSLGNLAGGILILTFRPFNVGDFIETQGYMGTVKEIQILYSRLTTADNKVIVIPNGELANAKVVNYSTEKTRRVDLIFGVSYEDDIIFVKELLTKIVLEHPLILKEPAPLVRVIEHAASSVNFAVRVWCQSEHYWDVYYDLHESVKIAFDQENISIPYPQTDIHLHTKESLIKVTETSKN